VNRPETFMARKLRPDEKHHFAVALQSNELVLKPDDAFQVRIEAKRDAALRLSPELEAWFGKDFLPWSES
jgi:hypothetical protein